MFQQYVFSADVTVMINWTIIVIIIVVKSYRAQSCPERLFNRMRAHTQKRKLNFGATDDW